MTSKKKISTLKNKLWELTKTYVRIRDKNTCQKCGKYVTGRQAETSHVVPKARGNVYRFNLDNLKVLCYRCHNGWWHGSPIDSVPRVDPKEWFENKFPERYKRIKALDAGVVQYRRKDYERMISELEDMIEEV